MDINPESGVDMAFDAATLFSDDIFMDLQDSSCGEIQSKPLSGTRYTIVKL